MEKSVALRVVSSRQGAFSPVDERGPAPLAAANKAVPLLWLALFDYDEIQVKPRGSIEVFGALTELALARRCARALVEALSGQEELLLGSAQALLKRLDKAPREGHLVLHPVEVFVGLNNGEAQSYLEQLVNLCDIWERLRGGLAWEETSRQLSRIAIDITRVLQQQDRRVARYYLIGDLADLQESLDEFLVREGQGEQDLEPEALVVGEQGLLLGRFDGTWKLMSSDSDQDLMDVWGEGDTAFIVGRHGTLVRLKRGRCKNVASPTKQHLKAIWGLTPTSVCVVGEGGTILVYNGQEWKPWAIPTQAALHCIAGDGPGNIYVAGSESGVMRYDGYSWVRLPLPEESIANQLCLVNGVTYAAGGSRQGGALFRLERSGFVRDDGLPRVDWLDGIWNGWGAEVGVIPSAGPVLINSGRGWRHEPVRAQQIHAVACGEVPMLLGSLSGYMVVLVRSEQGWEIEASIAGLQLRGIWVAGRPKPPRLTDEVADQGA